MFGNAFFFSASIPLPLDSITASAAYSLRKLRAAFSGSAIRVRRSSDNAEQDIGFTGSELDTSALLAFCGADSGFVTTWYDQTGNGLHQAQPTATLQPIIVSAGALITRNGKVSMSTNGRYLQLYSFIPAMRSALFVGERSATNGAFFEVSLSSLYRGFSLFSYGRDYEYFTSNFLNGNLTTSPTDVLNTLNVYTGVERFGTNSSAWILIGKGTPGFGPTTYMSEFIAFSTALSTTDRQTLERNQGTYFGITVA
jgi:hypothetical protein